MPKIDGTQLPERLSKRLEDLKSGKDVPARDIKALLTEEQIAEMEDAWTKQKELRQKNRPKSDDEKKMLGWKNQREIYIDTYEKALRQADKDVILAFKKMKRDSEVRQGRIYFETFGKVFDETGDLNEARNKANNALTRAGLQRLDGQVVHQRLRKRDQEIWEMEEKIRQQIRSELSEHDLQQQQLWEDHQKSLAGKHKK